MKQENSPSTVVIIPTRNRPDLAMNAIRSVLQDREASIRVVVSDNSTSEDDRKTLSDFCRDLSDPSLLYIAPPGELPMAAHWEWALNQALHSFDADHFMYLTDRSLFKPGALLNITQFACQYPDKIISFDWVTIFDHLSPIIVEPQRQTGQLLEVAAARLLFLSSRSIFPHSLPRMMNCCAPRSLLERMQARFGNVFESTSPDYNFCYRSLELVDSVLYYDYAAFVSCALMRSNAAAVVGIKTEANVDFRANIELGGHRRSYAAPMPAFETGTNYILHEYCLVQGDAGQKFPKVSVAHYLIRNVKDLIAILVYKLPLPVVGALAQLRNVFRKIFNLLWPPVTKHKPSRGFESLAEAIDYAIGIPPHDDASVSHLGVIGGPAQS